MQNPIASQTLLMQTKYDPKDPGFNPDVCNNMFVMSFCNPLYFVISWIWEVMICNIKAIGDAKSS